MRILGLLLLPFAVIYDLLTRARNRMFDTGARPSVQFDLPVLCVGNLAVGGTGKTPMVEYLVRLLVPERKVAMLSRGYGRLTKGPRIAGPSDTPSTIGDEPFQFYRKLGDRAVVAVGEERALAIPMILHQYPETDVIILDDAFQHRQVRPSFQILLTDYNRLFINDYVLPAGRLRESKRGAGRADVVVVTKCPPHLSEDEQIQIEHAIRLYANRTVFFSSVCYGNILPVMDNAPARIEDIVLVTGIANPAPLEAHLRQYHNIVRHFRFRDHHAYTARDFMNICDVALKARAVVVTTEKDLGKMNVQYFKNASVDLCYLPIEVEFLKNGKEFDEMVLNAVRSYAG